MSLADRAMLGPGLDKEATRRFASDHGFAMPEKLAEFVSVRDVDWSSLPPTFVLKPTNAHASRGVFLVAEGWSLLHGAPFDAVNATQEIEQLVADGVASGPVVIEEFVADNGGVPDDWKVYAFYGRVELVLQKRMNASRDPRRWQYKWRDGGLRHVGPIRWGHRYDETLPDPRHPKELVETAAKVSESLRLPFARIDLFDTDAGVVLGEITPRPGGSQVFPPKWDEQLGLAWEAAELRLRTCLRWGQADPPWV